MACREKDRSSGTAPNEMNRAGFSCPSVVLLLSTAPHCSKTARSGGSAPGVHVYRYISCGIASLLGVRTPVEIILQKSHLEGTGDDAWAQAQRSLQQALLSLNSGCLMGIAVTVSSLSHGSMGRVLVSSMAKFKITLVCNSSADLYSK